jgi:hypothetical protein
VADPSEVAIVRSWAGSAVEESVIDAGLARLGTPEAVALELLRQQRADLLATPAKLDATGDVAVDWSENLRHLATQIGALEVIVDRQVDPDVGTTRVVGLRRTGRIR